MWPLKMIKKIFKSKNEKQLLKDELEITKLKLRRMELMFADSKLNDTQSNTSTDNDEASSESTETCKHSSNYAIDPNCEFHKRLFVLYDLIEEFDAAGKYLVALTLCRKALTELKTIRCDQHPEVLFLKSKLFELRDRFLKFKNIKWAELVESNGKQTKKATNHTRTKIQNLLNDLPELKMPEYLQETVDLIKSYVEQNNFERAEFLCKDKLKMVIKLNGAAHVDVAKMLDFLTSKVYLGEFGRYEQALDVIENAVLIKVKIYGVHHLEIALEMNYLSIALIGLGREDEATLAIETALRIKQSLLGDDHYLVATEYNNLATHCFRIRKRNYEEIEQMLLKSLNILKSSNCTVDRKLLNKMISKVKMNLLVVLLEQGKFRELNGYLKLNLQ